MSSTPDLLALAGAALWVVAAPVAVASPPLISAGEVAGVDLQVFVRPGALTVTQPGTDGRPVAVRPLVSPTPGPVPADLTAWTALTPGACTDPASYRWKRGGEPASVRATGTWEEPVVEVSVAGTVVAAGRVGRPARICALHVQDVDDIPGEEVIVLWQTRRGATGEGSNTQGVSVLRIPETAQ